MSSGRQVRRRRNVEGGGAAQADRRFLRRAAAAARESPRRGALGSRGIVRPPASFLKGRSRGSWSSNLRGAPFLPRRTQPGLERREQEPKPRAAGRRRRWQRHQPPRSRSLRSKWSWTQSSSHRVGHAPVRGPCRGRSCRRARPSPRGRRPQTP